MADKTRVEHNASAFGAQRAGGGAPAKSKDQPHALTLTPGATLPSEIEEKREAAPIAACGGI
jgi:hypothetical protein